MNVEQHYQSTRLIRSFDSSTLSMAEQHMVSFGVESYAQPRHVARKAVVVARLHINSTANPFQFRPAYGHRDERMPKLFVPHKSDAHRLACTSLYRALLKQCNGLTSNTTSSGHALPSFALKDLVRYRFQRDRKLQSPAAIKKTLTSGHSHLELLYHSNLGSRSALTNLIEILKTTSDDIESKATERQLQRERQPPPKITPKALHIQQQATKALNRAPSDSVGLSAHPLPLSALRSESRIVPQLINGQKNTPFLRYGKQSVFLSRILRQTMKWKERQFGHLKALDMNYDLALAEDDWDAIIRRQLDREHGSRAAAMVDSLEPNWATEVRNVQNLIHSRIRAKEVQGQQLGMRMWEIVKQEQRLKDWEDLPINIARAVRNIRKLEVKVYQFTQRYSTKYTFQLRSHNDPITDEVECKQIGRFDIPVEFAKREKDSSPEYYAELEARLTDKPSTVAPRTGNPYSTNKTYGGHAKKAMGRDTAMEKQAARRGSGR